MRSINPSTSLRINGERSRTINPSTSLRVNGERPSTPLRTALSERSESNGRSRTIKFFTLGCKTNQYDTQSIRERFLSKGFRENGRIRQADYFLINTCTVTSGADRKSRNIIRKCIRSNSKAKVIVTGCLVEKDYRALADIRGISLVVRKDFFPEGISFFSEHTRAFLKIQDGCGNFCAYCKVALVRGKERSRNFNQVIDEAKKLAVRGYKEIVLTGICIGAYGRGLFPKRNLADLISALEKIKGLARIRISSIEAGDVSPGLIKRLASSKKFCRHLHIPIQSGDDRILKRMNRRYAGQKYQNLIARLKRSVPQISISTDCLVGFPGETEANFRNTLDLVKKIMPLKVHIFPYSSRPGTKAANFTGLVDSGTIKTRCDRMEEAGKRCRMSFMRKFIGKKVDVLIEGGVKDNSGDLEGLTDNYLKVRLPLKEGLKNKIIRARLKRIVGDSFIGEYVDNF